MTATAIAWIITISLWAGIIALVGIAAINRVFRRHHSHGRHPRPTEPPSSAAATLARRLSLLLVRRPLRDRTPQHEGATERYGAELRALRDLPPTPELIRATEQMVADHQALHTIGEAIAHFDQVIEAELDRFLSGMPLVRMRLPACAGATGEFDRAELDELLAVTG